MGSRTHHYHFAHQHFPGLLLRTKAAQRWLPILESPDGTGFVRSLWQSFGESLPPAERMAPDGIAVFSTRTPGGALLVCVRFPPPVEMPEAHFAAVLADPARPEILRYLTLEHSVNRTVFGEWTAARLHRNHGDGPPANEAAFYQAVLRFIGPLASPNEALLDGRALMTRASAARRSNPVEAKKLTDAAVERFASLRAWSDLSTLVTLLLVEPNDPGAAITYAQAFWLAMHPSVPVGTAIVIGTTLQTALGLESKLSGLVGAACVHKAQVHGEGQPGVDEQRAKGFQRLLAAAPPVVAANKESFMAWAQARGLLEPARFMSELYPALLEFVPEKRWLFDPEAVTGILV